MASEQFSLCWDNFHKNMSSGMNSLLENEDLVDVTLAVEGKCLKAHKMVLSVCSPYFKELFKSNPCQHPIVFMKDVSYEALSDLLQFMYQGEVQVSQENLTTFIKTAEALQIKGLTGDGNGSADSEASEVPTEKPQVQKEEYKQVVSRPKKQPAPTSIAPPQVKRSRLSVSSNESQPLPATVVSKTESSLVISPTESPHFKMEPYEQSHHSMTAEETGDENFGDETLDDHTVEDTEDYSMMETGGADEPQAGTSTDGTGEGQAFDLLNMIKEEKLEITDIYPSSPEDVNLEDFIPSDVSDNAERQVIKLPEKSRLKYEATYNRFMQWRADNNIDSFSEHVFLKYFNEMAKKYAPPSLWASYSMIRSILILRNNVNIHDYPRLMQFLRVNATGYKAKKCKTLRAEHIEEFIKEAPDFQYLVVKVALIFGIQGACRRQELCDITIDDIEDKGDMILVKIPKSKNGNPRSFVVTDDFYKLYRKYADLRPSDMSERRFFVCYRYGKCTKQVIGINNFGSMPKSVATYLNLDDPESYTSHTFRKTSASLGNGFWMR